MLIISWNINSIKVRIGQLLWMIDTIAPDIILLQELKCTEENFPYETIANHPNGSQYTCIVYGQKAYNGVAILSKRPILEAVKHNFAVMSLREALLKCNEASTKTHNKKCKDIDNLAEARYVEAVVPYKNNSTIRIGSVYVPNGTSVKSPKFQYKLAFYDDMRKHMNNLLSQEEMIVIGGDLNVAPEAIDVRDPIAMEGSVAFHPEERKRVHQMIADGYCDSFRFYNPDQQQFSWWDYRNPSSFHTNNGMRIDLLLSSPKVNKAIVDVGIHKNFRIMEKPSDHVPVSIRLE